MNMIEIKEDLFPSVLSGSNYVYIHNTYAPSLKIAEVIM